METLIAKINTVISNQLPSDKFYINVRPYKGAFNDGSDISIVIAAKPIGIGLNGVQMVSLMLNAKSMRLYVQGFGGNGGQSIHRKPNLNNPDERWLAMKSEKVSFRTPNPTEIKVLTCIETFTKNYVNKLIEHKDVLMYQDKVNYDELLGYTM